MIIKIIQEDLIKIASYFYLTPVIVTSWPLSSPRWWPSPCPPPPSPRGSRTSGPTASPGSRGWRLEAWGWRLEAKGWRLEDGGCRLQAAGYMRNACLRPEGESWRLKAGGWRLKAEGWRLKAGSWRLEVGCWRMERERRHPDGSQTLKRLQDISACIRIPAKKQPNLCIWGSGHLLILVSFWISDFYEAFGQNVDSLPRYCAVRALSCAIRRQTTTDDLGAKQSKIPDFPDVTLVREEDWEIGRHQVILWATPWTMVMWL